MSLPLFQHLTLNGGPSSASNSPDVLADFSGNPAEFFVHPPVDRVFELHTMTFSVIGAPGVAFVRNGYGALAALPGALQLRLFDGPTVVAELTPPIHTLPDWHAVGATCPEQVLYMLLDMHRADFTLDLRRVFGETLVLDGRTQVSLSLHVDANMTTAGLSGHRFAVQGLVSKL